MRAMEHAALQLFLDKDTDLDNPEYQPQCEFLGVLTATEGCQGIENADFIENSRSGAGGMIGIEIKPGKTPSIKPLTLQLIAGAPLFLDLMTWKLKRILTHMVR